MKIKNGRIVKGTINKEDMVIGKKIISKVNNKVFDILNGKMIYDFEIKMLKITIHLLYTNNPLKSLRKLEYLTNVNINEFKNYSCNIDASDSVIDEISQKIADEIYNTLKGSSCYNLSVLNNRQRKEITPQRKAFQTLCDLRFDVIGSLRIPSCNYGLYYKVIPNTKLFVGNDAFRTSINNENKIDVDGYKTYVDTYNFILQNGDIIDKYLQKITELGNEVNGRYRLDEKYKLIFHIYGSTKVINNIKTIREIIENGLSIDDELNNIRTWTNEVRMEKEREEEENRKEIIELKKEILNQPISQDIYTFIQQASSQSVDAIINSIIEKGISDKANEIESLITKMTKAHLLIKTELKSYLDRDKTIVLYNVDENYTNTEVA